MEIRFKINSKKYALHAITIITIQEKINVMRKIKLFIASSLDGCIARSDGSVDWLPEHAKSGYDEFYKTIDTVIMGRKTYEQILSFGAYPYEGKKSYVFTSNADQKNNENVEFVSNVEELTKELFLSSGKDVWLIGGSLLISFFLNHGLIDEIILSVIPLMLRKGIPLFKDLQEETKLELIKTTQYDELVEMQYRVLK